MSVPRYYGSEEQRYRPSALDHEHREHMANLDHHRRLVDRRAGSLEREIFRSTARDLRKTDEQPEPPAPLSIDVPDLGMSDDDLDEGGLF